MKIDLDKLHVLHYPDPCLRTKCKPVAHFGPDLAALGRRMLDLMHSGKGVGLAAPQVGLPLRMFVMNPTDNPADDMVLINPVIVEKLGSAEAVEGCLSLPGVDVHVRRAASCGIRAHDVNGQLFELKDKDLAARVWQHETDHLDGVLIIDKMAPSDTVATRNILKALEEGYKRRRRTRAGVRVR